MSLWPKVSALGALVLLAACADQSAFTQADRDRRAALTRCSTQAQAARPVWNAKQLHSLPGQPRPMSPEWSNEYNRRVADCLSGPSDVSGRALDTP